MSEKLNPTFRKMENLDNRQRAIIWYLWKKGKKAAEIARELSEVFEDYALSYVTVTRWVNRFREGDESLKDQPRSGRPSTSTTETNLARVRTLVNENRKMSVRQIANELDLSYGTVREILYNGLGIRKICARWVPRALEPEQKAERVRQCQVLKILYDDYGQSFFSRIATQDETWIPYYNPETKLQSKEWVYKGEPAPKKPKILPKTDKVMLTVFWDCDGIILKDFLPKGRRIDAEYYCSLLQHDLHRALLEKRPGKLHKRILLQHDNARPHIAKQTQGVIRAKNWEVLPHPPYSPDLAPSDFYLFGPMKDFMRGKNYGSLNEIKADLNEWQKCLPENWFSRGIRKLPERWDRCIESAGEYFD